MRHAISKSPYSTTAFGNAKPLRVDTSPLANAQAEGEVDGSAVNDSSPVSLNKSLGNDTRLRVAENIRFTNLMMSDCRPRGRR